ncbi:putative inactive purple acid phosphatase 24 [Auxenochlorella protothecoides]|uniref:Putative inactive purple acid phosphatase 24 n=1 Tax=Auxenochlorella protothecoides TaxID=3075 RepID=A0A087SNZ7_AUXPR|nr:putative inactive purple acid phosphatase 24 [Auxenochlorella protothecoides]KFM27451.1 putative inactive purple acid phosphatase 24 [Auxenochlorella protothecoides]
MYTDSYYGFTPTSSQVVAADMRAAFEDLFFEYGVDMTWQVCGGVLSSIKGWGVLAGVAGTVSGGVAAGPFSSSHATPGRFLFEASARGQAAALHLPKTMPVPDKDRHPPTTESNAGSLLLAADHSRPSLGPSTSPPSIRPPAYSPPLAPWTPPQGHLHNYQRTCPVYNNTCVDYDDEGVARGPIHVTMGHNGFMLTPFYQPEAPNAFDGQPTFASFGYCRAEVNRTHFNLQVTVLPYGVQDRSSANALQPRHGA